jgi:hypothetical protein
VQSLAPLPPLLVLVRFDDAGYRVTSLTSVDADVERDDADEERADPDEERGRDSLELRVLLGFLTGELGNDLGGRSGEMLERPEREGVDSEKYEENRLLVTELRAAFGEWSSES